MDSKDREKLIKRAMESDRFYENVMNDLVNLKPCEELELIAFKSAKTAIEENYDPLDEVYRILDYGG